MSDLMRWLLRGARLVLGGVFLYAGLAKFVAPQDFADTLFAYGVMPRALINPVAVVLPLWEILLGIMLVCGLAKRICAGVAGLLCVLFMVVLALAWVRGIKVDCGCFGSAPLLNASPLVALGRDILLFGMAVFVFRATCSRQGAGRVDLNHAQ